LDRLGGFLGDASTDGGITPQLRTVREFAHLLFLRDSRGNCRLSHVDDRVDGRDVTTVVAERGREGG
jgi:hypothetical protein